MSDLISSQTKSGTDVFMEVHIDASPEIVFPYLVEPEKMVRWIGHAITSAGTVGASYSLDMWGDGTTVVSGEFLVIDPPKQVVFTWGWEGDPALGPGASTVTIDLAVADGGTSVTLTHTGLDAAQAESHSGGWQHFLERLTTRATGGSPGPNYSMDFLNARTELQAAELDLMLAREAVAEARRSLPAGPLVENYPFDTNDGEKRLTELFSAPERTLVLYHFMFGKAHEQPCQMCSMWADGWNGVAKHLDQRLDFAVVSSADMATTNAMVEQRGWNDLRWVSSADTDFKIDIGGENQEGHLMTFFSVYRLVDGQAQLTWSGGAHIDGDHWRGVDLLSPVWHFLDLTPEGRGEWMPSLSY